MERPEAHHEDGEPHSPGVLDCCCGRTDCSLLKKNRSILETVEKDVHTAAQLGQALLQRHEAYMADAERDRLNLNARIERLEMDKQELEADNALKIEENRNLLDHLEVLNSTVSESDTKIQALEASLLSSQQSVRRLESAADRAADAERHLAILEQEQAHLQQLLESSKDDARTHSQRCKEAQRGILDMQDQLERIEAEAKEERERHTEIIGRMERQREIEKQLDVAASRLKGAAATKTLQTQKHGNIVGHFVRDLLSDNANLQLGIAELRELLHNANNEVETLRDQLMCHQPLPDSRCGTTLKAELEPIAESPKLQQQFHIHHHYHVTPKQDRKPKKKRVGGSGIYTPPSFQDSPTPSSHWLTSSPGAPALLSMSNAEPTMSSSVPRQSWTVRSVMSDAPSDVASSVPSSPRSNQRNSLFDSSFNDGDLPTSPATSFDPTSPDWRAHRKGPSDISALSFQTTAPDEEGPTTPQPARHRRFEGTIHEEDEEDEQPFSKTPDLMTGGSEEDSTVEGSVISREDFFSRPRIHRVVSHESIMSLTGGLDIHTLKARPSQMTLRPLGGAEAIVTVTGVTAQPTLSRGSTRGSAVALRDNFAGLPLPRRSTSTSRTRSQSPNPAQGRLGKWVGWRPWGGSAPNVDQPTTKPTEKEPDKDKDQEGVEGTRAPGINQPGAIPGFQKYWAGQRTKGTPATVATEVVNHTALVDGLQE